jgi:hypothetical protein
LNKWKGIYHRSRGSNRLIRVNVWIKIIIIIVLKYDLRVYSRQGLSHKSKVSIRVYQKQFKKKKHVLIQKIKNKINKFFTCVLSWVKWVISQPRFLTRLVGSILHLDVFFLTQTSSGPRSALTQFFF